MCQVDRWGACGQCEWSSAFLVSISLRRSGFSSEKLLGLKSACVEGSFFDVNDRDGFDVMKTVHRSCRLHSWWRNALPFLQHQLECVFYLLVIHFRLYFLTSVCNPALVFLSLWLESVTYSDFACWEIVSDVFVGIDRDGRTYLSFSYVKCMLMVFSPTFFYYGAFVLSHMSSLDVQRRKIIFGWVSYFWRLWYPLAGLFVFRGDQLGSRVLRSQKLMNGSWGTSCASRFCLWHFIWGTRGLPLASNHQVFFYSIICTP